MNSYPVELLVQHAPLMFVAGLGDSSSSPVPNSANGDLLGAPPLHERRGSVNQDAKDPFLVLSSRLRNSFASRRRGAVWDLNKSHHFNILLVDKVNASWSMHLVHWHAKRGFSLDRLRQSNFPLESLSLRLVLEHPTRPMQLLALHSLL